MFLANENFPRPSVNILRENGIIIKYISEDSPGISDEEVTTIATKLDLIILTFDKDYGELIFRHSIKNPPSVIFFREKGNKPTFPGEVMLTLLLNPNIHFKNSFTVVETNSIRQRSYLKE